MDINWEEVYQAMKRCKYDRRRPGDIQLCEAALKADPERYNHEHKRMLDAIMSEMNPLWRKS